MEIEILVKSIYQEDHKDQNLSDRVKSPDIGLNMEGR